jgi:hypothetical protein
VLMDGSFQQATNNSFAIKSVAIYHGAKANPILPGKKIERIRLLAARQFSLFASSTGRC